MFLNGRPVPVFPRSERFLLRSFGMNTKSAGNAKPEAFRVQKMRRKVSSPKKIPEYFN
jgi:hypothetical protein